MTRAGFGNRNGSLPWPDHTLKGLLSRPCRSQSTKYDEQHLPLNGWVVVGGTVNNSGERRLVKWHTAGG